MANTARRHGRVRFDGLSHSDDEFVRRNSRHVVNKATQSTDTMDSSRTPTTGHCMTTECGERTNATGTGARIGSFSLNAVKPKVALVIYILQAVSFITKIVMDLATALYVRFFTTHRRSPPSPPSEQGTPTSAQQLVRGGYQCRTSRPHLPNEKSIAAQILWNYMKLDEPLVESDVILLLGNHDVRTSQHACQLWIDGWAEYILYTGIANTKEGRVAQVRKFEEISEALNVPQEAVLLETSATDILAAILNSHKMLDRLRLKFSSIIVVHLPFTERLVQLTFLRTWPDQGTTITISSPLITLIDFPNEVVGSSDQVIADLSEAVDYVFQADTQAVESAPVKVLKAFCTLRPCGADMQKAAQKALPVGQLIKNRESKVQPTHLVSSNHSSSQKSDNTIREKFSQFMDK